MDAAIDLLANLSQRKVLPKWQYNIISEILYQLDLGEYHTYGIQVITLGYVDILHDVSVCKKTAARIAELLNYHQVSPVHLQDVVMDMLP